VAGWKRGDGSALRDDSYFKGRFEIRCVGETNSGKRTNWEVLENGERILPRTPTRKAWVRGKTFTRLRDAKCWVENILRFPNGV
jgi:hypothetical protein